MKHIDINCDMGEGFGPYDIGNDAAMLKIVTSANLACGFHGGDPHIMAARCHAAKAAGVAIGAHPGYPDLAGFGRRPMQFDAAQVAQIIAYQVGALEMIAASAGHRVTHLKVHGAFGHLVGDEPWAALALVDLMASLRPDMVLTVMAATELHRLAAKRGLRHAVEIFADRAYDDDGRLMARGKPGAVIHDPEVAAQAVSAMLAEGAIITASGRRIALDRIDTVCVHGDTAGAPDIARAVAGRLRADGFDLRAP